MFFFFFFCKLVVIRDTYFQWVWVAKSRAWWQAKSYAVNLLSICFDYV